MSLYHGKCLCGAVSIRLLTAPTTMRICWCRDCQHLSGNGTANLLVASDAVESSGPLTSYAKTANSGNTVTRWFCQQCGTHIYADSSGRPQFKAVRVGNFSDTSRFQLQGYIWAASAPHWACMDAALSRTEAQPANPQPTT